jgi:hypothetical protein
MREIESGDNISTIILALDKCFESRPDIWFRGQPRYCHSLIPSIFRQGAIFGRQFNESEMYLEFVRRYPRQSGKHKNVAEWLTLMQHYGVPTRVLDWTTNLLVAVYFCCKKDQEQDAAIFAFDPSILLRDFSFNKLLELQVLSSSVADFYKKIIFESDGIIDDDALINSYSVRQIKQDPLLQIRFTHISKQMPFESVAVRQVLPNTVDPNGNLLQQVHVDITRAFSNVIPLKYAHVTSRARLQHGYFTLHGGKYYEGREFVKVGTMEDHPYLTDNLVKAKVKASHKPRLLRELQMSGISECTLFPEMDYQGKDICERYTHAFGA